jgi:hypothetical protein
MGRYYLTGTKGTDIKVLEMDKWEWPYNMVSVLITTELIAHLKMAKMRIW